MRTQFETRIQLIHHIQILLLALEIFIVVYPSLPISTVRDDFQCAKISPS